MTDSKLEGITDEERAKQPWHDLEGALVDLQCVSTTDPICLQTIARACRNLFAYESRLSATERERDALKERVERLEAALRPFATNAERFEDSDDYVIYQSTLTHDGDLPALTVGDFRSAREALAGKLGEDLLIEQNEKWFIWTKNGRAPKFAHDTEADALQEAHRLAIKFPGAKFHVMKSIKKVSAVQAPAPQEADDE